MTQGAYPRSVHKGASAEALKGIDVVILAGGLGTRIQPVLGSLPKVLAPIAEGTFLDILLVWLGSFGARRVIPCLGHGADQVLAHLARHAPAGMEICPSVEPTPLGTGGAIRHAMPQLVSDPVLVMNGDTFLDADLGAFVNGHRSRKAALSLLCASVPSLARFGAVDCDDQGNVLSFMEKDPGRTGPGVISAGIYLFSRLELEALSRVGGPSLEEDFLRFRPPGHIHGEICSGRFIDIGTPDSLRVASRIILGSEGEWTGTEEASQGTPS
ncbi:nucleotidyltransferase family protein [Rhodospirillum sp. A1_3_36]|uniref:nucleotidyltransferase family protein n=1 Tax=Rhodospirillum sp. A1_3_36 TaxID=3391666 RepID=UPI0039A4355E